MLTDIFNLENAYDSFENEVGYFMKFGDTPNRALAEERAKAEYLKAIGDLTVEMELEYNHGTRTRYFCDSLRLMSLRFHVGNTRFRI